MNQRPRTGAQAGGFLLAISVLAGAVGGIIAGEASAGFLIGLAVGAALALLLWWKDRR